MTDAGEAAPEATERPSVRRAPGGAYRPAIKVCGITRAADAWLAVDGGADAIGFVFWPRSPRAVSLEVARGIVRQLPPFVATVGVFVNQDPSEVLEVARAVPLTAVQFHGDEADTDVCGFPWRVLRAVALEDPGTPERLAQLPPTVTVLLDAHDPHRRGGTGRRIDWAAAAQVASRRRVLLAGGLNPENVAEAIEIVRPWGVDVSSGVEASPGVKDGGKLRSFLRAVRSA